MRFFPRILLSAALYAGLASAWSSESYGGIVIRLDEVTAFNNLDPFGSAVTFVASADDSSTVPVNNATLSSPSFPTLGFSYSITANSNSPGDSSAWVSEFTTELRLFDQGPDIRQFLVTVASDEFSQPGNAGDLLDLMNSLNLLSATTTSGVGSSDVVLRSFVDADGGALNAATYLPSGSAVYTSAINDPNIVDGLFASSTAAFTRPSTFIVGSQALITLAGSSNSSVQFRGMSEAVATAVVPEAASIVAWALCILAVMSVVGKRRKQN